ncbi:hypothetical protein DFS33DRAFT_4290 [Desarmillaria ectypa]|nr:hypothetical protein DFS33DRAFT_4290 [Desarmillaria ectypa]
MFSRLNTETAIPELTESQVKNIFQNLDIQLNSTILSALLHGFYTGVIVITLWTIVQSKSRLHGRGALFLIVVILFLYIFATVNALTNWVYLIRSFIMNGKNFWTIYITISMPIYFLAGVTGCLSMILADTSLIWRCWTVWGRSWHVVLVPTICTLLAVETQSAK